MAREWFKRGGGVPSRSLGRRADKVGDGLFAAREQGSGKLTMRYLLSAASRSIVKRLAEKRTLCAFDFDGTLCPIVDHPDLADMRATTRDLLACLAVHYPCVVISGRARADVMNKLNGVKVARVIGNHGAETKPASRPRRVQRWKIDLEREIGSLPGLWVEDKGLSLAAHYRHCTDKKEARRRILAAAQKLKHVRVFGGKQVVNLMAELAPHKGDALKAERDRLGCAWVLYVGDDDNDEDAFALDGNIVSVRIGRKQQSHARYYLRTQTEIDELLELLLRWREAAAK